MKATICGLILPAILFSAAAPSFAADTAAQNTITLKHFVLSGNSGIAGLGDVEVSFQNDGSVGAKHIEFVVTKLDGSASKLQDVGEFPPGVTLTHDLRVQSLMEGGTVGIDEVDYDDGSVWTARGPRRQEH
jgi:hypothetical protein